MAPITCGQVSMYGISIRRRVSTASLRNSAVSFFLKGINIQIRTTKKGLYLTWKSGQIYPYLYLHTHDIFLVWNWPYFYVDFGSILDYQACDSNCSHTQNPGCYSSYYSVFCNIYSLWRSYYQWYLLRCAVTQNFPLQSGSLIYQAGYKQIYLGNLSQERLHKKCAIHEKPVGSWHFV